MENISKLRDELVKLIDERIISKRDLKLEDLPYVKSSVYVEPLNWLVIPDTTEGNLIFDLAKKINEIIDIINEKL